MSSATQRASPLRGLYTPGMSHPLLQQTNFENCSDIMEVLSWLVVTGGDQFLVVYQLALTGGKLCMCIHVHVHVGTTLLW